MSNKRTQSLGGLLVERLLLATITLMIGGTLQASTVIDCPGPSATQVSNCVGSIPTFDHRLDWAALGQPFNGTVFNGTWSANNVDNSGNNVSVGSQSAGSGEGLRLAYNIGLVMIGGVWTDASVSGIGYNHPGHFLTTSTPAASIPALQADPTIQLMGLALNGTSALPSMLLNFSTGLTSFGFYGASQHNADFSLRVQVFAGANGTGALLNDNTFSYSPGNGGICPSLLTPGGPPVGCNNAPFYFGSGFTGNGAQSIVVSTSDNRGFYLSGIYFSDVTQIPEPTTVVLSGCGLLFLAAAGRKFRRTAQ